jgi:hypothetical protein
VDRRLYRPAEFRVDRQEAVEACSGAHNRLTVRSTVSLVKPD